MEHNRIFWHGSSITKDTESMLNLSLFNHFRSLSLTLSNNAWIVVSKIDKYLPLIAIDKILGEVKDLCNIYT